MRLSRNWASVGRLHLQASKGTVKHPIKFDSLKYRRLHSGLGMRVLLLTVMPLLTVLAGIGMGGCNTQGCTDNRSALPLMGFYSNATGARMMLDSLDLGGVDAPYDTLLVHSGQSVNSLYIPFRYYRDVTAFYFHYDYPAQGLDDPALNDTITFRYTTEPYFASEECGAFYIYTIRSFDYTTHLIERVEVVDSVINNVDMERIKVYFRVVEPDEPEIPDEPEDPDNPDAGGDDAGDEPGEEQMAGRRVAL